MLSTKKKYSYKLLTSIGDKVELLSKKLKRSHDDIANEAMIRGLREVARRNR